MESLQTLSLPDTAAVNWRQSGSRLFNQTRKSEELNRILPQVDYVTLCSASAVRAYVSMLDEVGRQSDPRIICIGPVTERAAKAAGLTVHQSAVVYTAEGIKDVLLYDKRVVK